MTKPTTVPPAFPTPEEQADWQANDWQEAHSPTDAVTVTIANASGDRGKREEVICRRRRDDARIWNAMSPEQTQAAERIRLAFNIITGDVALRGFDPLRKPGGSSDPERMAAITTEYFEWGRAVQRERLSHAAALDFLAYGQSLRAIDTARRKRKGWAKINLLACLDEFAKMKGWITASGIPPGAPTQNAA